VIFYRKQNNVKVFYSITIEYWCCSIEKQLLLKYSIAFL